MKELGLGASWIVLEDDLMSLEKEPGVIRDLYLVSSWSTYLWGFATLTGDGGVM